MNDSPNFINVFMAFTVLLFCKWLVLNFIRKKITVARTRQIAFGLAFLLSPIAGTVWLAKEFPQPSSFAFIPTSFFSVIIEIAILQWVRTIFEPPSTTHDLDYPHSPDVTNF